MKPVTLGRLDALFNSISYMPAYTRILRRVRRGVTRTEMINRNDTQQKFKIKKQINTIKKWLAQAEEMYLK